MRFADRLARVLIRFGGLGTIATVVLVCVFLVWVVIPLFARPSLERNAGVELEQRGNARAIQLVVDEYGSMTAAVLADEADQLKINPVLSDVSKFRLDLQFD